MLIIMVVVICHVTSCLGLIGGDISKYSVCLFVCTVVLVWLQFSCLTLIVSLLLVCLFSDLVYDYFGQKKRHTTMSVNMHVYLYVK